MHMLTNQSFIYQPHSRARLSISERAAKMIFSRMSILPSFESILTCFGVENGPCAAGRSGFYEETQTSAPDTLSKQSICFYLNWKEAD
jgi:hypothetical protein